jgi:chemotaxis protein MotB
MTRVDDYQDDLFNPYIVLSDLTLNLVLILVFFIAAVTVVGKVGWEQVRYKEAQELVRQGIQETLPLNLRPQEAYRNDPPGVQRWVFPNYLLFQSDSTLLSETGRRVLLTFAEVLRENPEWRRIRIEGHTRPPLPGEPDDWELSTARSASVARIFTAEGDIPPWFLAVSGRAGQNPLNYENRDDPANQRVEILLEYSANSSGLGESP